MEYIYYNALKFEEILISDNPKGVILLQYSHENVAFAKKASELLGVKTSIGVDEQPIYGNIRLH